MEHYQSTQARAYQTIAVINQYAPSLTVGGISTGVLISAANNLTTSAATRDLAIATTDQAVNSENLNSLLIRTLGLSLPQMARGELDEDKPAEADLLELFDEALGITPRTTPLRIKRGNKVIAALTKVNVWLAAQLPARPAITAGGKNVSHLTGAISGQHSLELATETATTAETAARITLDTEDHAVDRINKRFYQKLLAEARTNPALAAALPQIDTETDNLPGTLSIASVIQGGDDLLHILVAYVNGTGSNADERLLDWMVVGVDADFTHTIAVDLSGNLIGPFIAGQTVKIRTRTINTHGTRTSATRTLLVQGQE